MWRRIAALIRKELASLWQDPKMRAVLLIPPLMQAVVFAYAATYDVTRVPLGIWSEDPGAPAAELIRRFAFSPAFSVAAPVAGPAEATVALDTRRIAAILHIPQTFSADVLRGKIAQLQLLLDARRSNTALMVDGYASRIVADYAAGLHAAGQLAAGLAPVTLETRTWFNPTLESQWFILPGLVATLSLMMAMIVSALSLAREKELGTFEQLLVTPLRPAEIMVGKAIPAILVGMVEANIILLAALLWFRLPFRGSFVVLEAALLIFLLAGVSVGLVISTVTRTQQQAILGVFIYASPAVMLSGFASPVENMPPAAQALSRLDPIRYMLVIARGQFLEAMPLDVVLHQVWPMAAIAACMMGIAALYGRRVSA